MFTRLDLLHPVLRAASMQEADRLTMIEWGLPGRTLMETAGRACADAIERLASGDDFARPREATVLAGKGNNGGDGLVIARVLHARGWTVRVVSMASGDESTEDTAANLALLERIAQGSDRLTMLASEADLGRASGVIVDALLGIGVRGELREPVASLARWTNRQRPHARVLSVDVPSGLNADTGAAPGDTVCADATVAMGALKPGLLLGDGPRLASDVTVADIGIPRSLLRDHADAWVAGDAWLSAVLPQRAADAHKYSAGKAVCVVGSGQFTGAAVLSTRAAYRAGAGAVICCTPEVAQQAVDAQNVEVMVDAQPQTTAGGLALAAYDAIRQRLDGADAALIGCGLGDASETQQLVHALLPHLGHDGPPAVLDADGLSAFAGDPSPLAEHAAGRVLLTPHLGELRRLLGDEDFSPEDRISTTRDLAATWDSVLLLKGMPSVLASPDGTVGIGPPGHPALATAGTGDVLAGTAVGLLAQGLTPEDAGLAALHLGWKAAEAYEGRPGSLIASDLLA